MRALLGIDAGTSAVTTVAYDTDGDVLAAATETQSVTHPEPGWAEQEMRGVWNRVADTIERVVAALDEDVEIAGIGVTGQGDGCWLIDGDGEPVRNAVLWSDSRAAPIIEAWQNDGTMDALVSACGSPVYPGMTLPVLAWLDEHEPEALERATTAFSCKDWLVAELTGVQGTDYTEATVPFLDRETRQFNPTVFESASISEHRVLVPEIRSGTDVVGTVAGDAASRTGLPEGTPVVAGAIDVAASAVGAGAVEPGDGVVSLGTSLFTQTITESPGVGDRGIGMAFGIGDRWTTAIGSNAGTPSLEWVCEEILEDDEIEVLEPIAASAPAGSEGVLFLPYLSSTGERGPFTDPTARAGFVGLEPGHDRSHVVRSVYEGLSLAVRDCLEHLPEAPNRVFLTGGGSRSSFWCDLLTDCLGVELLVPEAEYPAAKGAATLLAVGLEIEPSLEQADSRLGEIAQRYRPDGDVAATYDELYDHYRRTRRDMQPIWERRAALGRVLGHDSDSVATR
ncbi:FGGY-family carbohydrate kinase [Natronococcus occultus]|uniref:Pentulose/hexulose kinase n=1 Tax=Natronococcus occultus SP4 TaxID=694430 RepID=L0JYW7_9EURY|nr:FGGY-family carbohydrate kinase [Natronococcus occultus]AGB37063.1 pentulose/hexulose kinase [Natronococcus occultus SP4]